MMQKLILVFILAAAGVGVFFFFFPQSATEPLPSPEENGDEIPAVSIVAENLEIPWDIAFLPDGEMLVTERGGRILLIGEDGGRQEIARKDIVHRGEGGLLGLTLHPNFPNNRLLYLYMTAEASDGGLQNRVVRYRLTNNALEEDRVIIEGIPGAPYHDGGRIEFGPDGKLYITTGDATVTRLAQDLSSLAGKILRLHEDGSIPKDNPFGTAIYSYGHRNPQGLAWDSTGRLWQTEHGRSGVLSGLDEINIIRSSENYGWPESEGDRAAAGTISPILHSGADDTWAPASAVILGNSLFFGGLRGEALYEAILDGERVVELKTHFKNEFGRIRTVRVGPDGMLYLTTSNRDGRGAVHSGDDKIIRINLELL